MTRRAWVFLVAAAIATAGCGTSDTDGPCAASHCTPGGTCITELGAPYCLCIPDYHPVGLTCVPNDSTNACLGVDCNDHGSCIIVASSPACVCQPGYHHPDD